MGDTPKPRRRLSLQPSHLTQPSLTVREGFKPLPKSLANHSCVSLVASGKVERKIENSECCKIPNTNREFWVAKIRRNQERDIEEQKRLAEMGWHCITIWECELNPKKREETLKALAYTLNKIWLDDHQAVVTSYPKLEEESEGYLKAAEERE